MEKCHFRPQSTGKLSYKCTQSLVTVLKDILLTTQAQFPKSGWELELLTQLR